MIKPRQPAPALDVPLVEGGRWALDQQRPESFTVVVFYRGGHCPICREYVTRLNGLVGEFAAAGVTSLVAVSGDEEWRARKSVDEWQLDRLKVGYSLPLTSMRQWGLYVSKAIKEGQPNEFSEPGLFVVRPDGTLYAAVLNTMPFMRPVLSEVVETLRWAKEKDYPARGEV